MQIKGDDTFTTVVVGTDTVTITGTHRAITDSASDDSETSISAAWANTHAALSGGAGGHIPTDGTDGYYLSHDGTYAQVAYSQISNAPGDTNTQLTQGSFIIPRASLVTLADLTPNTSPYVATITHGMGTNKCMVSLWESANTIGTDDSLNTSEMTQVYADMKFTDAATLEISFKTLPAGDIRVIMIEAPSVPTPVIAYS